MKEGRIPMRHSPRRAPAARAALWAAALSALALPCAVRAQDADAARGLEADLQKARADVEKARKDVQKAEADLRKTDSLLRDENEQAAASEQRAQKDRERREKENAALQARVQETQAQIDRERASLGRQQNAEDEIKARQKRLSQLLAGYCDSLARRIQAAPPWDNEARLDRVRSLKKDLETGSATPDEGFARLNALLRDEAKAGDEIALIGKPIARRNGEVVNAQVLKIGNQGLAYMDEEGKRFGVLERKPGGAWEWREDPGFEEKNRIKAAIEIKGAKRPPSLAVLDLGIAPGPLSLPAPAASAPASPSATAPAPAAAPIPPVAPKGGK
jgi:hypothetical protein